VSQTINDQFLLAVRAGLVSGHRLVHKFGSNDSVGTTKEDIWPLGGSMAWMTSAEKLTLVSSDTTNDIASGSGARSVKIIGLDNNFNEVSETISLASTAVTTIQDFIRIETARVITNGSYTGANLGTITIAGATSGNTHAVISAGDGRTTQTHYTIPAEKTGIMLHAAVSMDTGKSISVNIHKREDADMVVAPFGEHNHIHHWTGIDTPVSQAFNSGLVLKEKTDVWMDAVVTTGSASVDADYDILLIDNVFLNG